MNDPNRKIDVNISSLLSLKAELLRKQTEVNQAKTRQSAQPFVPKSFEKPAVQPKPNSKNPSTKRVELEDNEQLERSRKILEAKSKFYDRMTASGGSVNSDDTCLVLFNAKKQTDKVAETSSSDESEPEPLKDDPGDADWVEYTDSLGRTRKCLRSDLEFFKKRDDALVKDLDRDRVKERTPMEEQKPVPQEESSESSESEDELLKTGRQIQQIRDQWDKQEEENKDKDFVHYQDVLFNEARTHGVSYFQFSTDAEERLKQQKELEKERKATLEAQKEREDQRSAREKIINERVLAAKNRQRARLGLPPLDKMPEQSSAEPEENQKASTSKEDEDKSEEDAIRESERKSHLRPWDVGKEGTSHLAPKEEKEWSYKGHREPMSQAEWNEKKREERNSEFAPTDSLSKSKKNPNTREHQSSHEAPSVDQPKAHVPEQWEEEEEEQRPGLYFTTKKKLKRRNYQPDEETDTKKSVPAGGAEIPPPPTFEYYGPSVLGLNKRPKQETKPNLESSIEAGLKFLRNQTDKAQSTSKSLWGANANYGKDM